MTTFDRTVLGARASMDSAYVFLRVHTYILASRLILLYSTLNLVFGASMTWRTLGSSVKRLLRMFSAISSTILHFAWKR